ncbi:flavodoxin family protein [Flavilitoribacter nigricans]|uniref:FMN reductase n=1 Tax=Flavilitoribacter nigricans (strain ATCC 23147 / DSM 23189 / NBRC 102662 / NCIMB 1420 / SS-2) TaxID=1122177 RepID=A0A2D0N8K5_FLAN2|nr:NAD(P)H-dependent oxidoreductase [Flavilitoribacter nigricans]PHN04844.1 FMN reductase [Flavilitoribacter nigricans DSM 23189 = NBRC 102662]
MTNTLIIFASSREQGNTRKIAEAVRMKSGADFLNISDLNISAYDYEHRNRHDDFIPTFEKIAGYQNFIFITPVYWYSMAGPMKIFFDRMTDLMTIRKDLGRSLAGKSMAAICCSSDEEAYPGFFMPFARTADYLDMHYRGDCHTWIEGGEIPAIVLQQLDQLIANVKVGVTI